MTLPNGWQYTFTYDPQFGDITKVTLPSGGYIRYDYTVLPQADGGPVNLYCFLDSRRVAHRYVSPDGNPQREQTWTYAYTTVNSITTTVTDPLGNVTVHTFIMSGNPNAGGRIPHEAVTQFQQNGTAIKTVSNTWAFDTCAVQSLQSNGHGSVLMNDAVNARITDTTTTLNDTSQVSDHQTDYDSYQPPAFNCSSSTESRMNPTEVREYDYGNGAAGLLLRKTDFTYLHNSNSNYLNAHIWDRTTSKLIYDGSNNLKAQTTYAYDGSSVQSTSGAPGHDYTNYSSANNIRGNLTQMSRWLNTSGTWQNTVNTYNDLGDLLSTTDPRNNTTNFSYTDNFTDGVNRNALAFVTQTTYPTTNGISHIERKQFYWYTSLPAASCGQNFPQASACTNTASVPQPDYTTSTYDLMNRPQNITRGDGGQTNFTYNDTVQPLSISSTQSINGGNNLAETALLDGMGRTKQFQLTSDPQGTVFTDTTYDAFDRASTVSNPYRSTSEQTYGITTAQYDALGRTISITLQDGSISTTSYTGNCTTVTDAAGKSRKSCTDALGRLIQVFEDPGSSPHLNYETDYTYDALDNLLTVNQKGNDPNSANWRTRTFTYNSLSQLLTASNPESGVITYNYDQDTSCTSPNSYPTLLVSKLDARGIRTCMQYDALNRLTQKSYSDGTPTAAFLYDVSVTNGVTISNPVGRLVRATAGSCTQTINSYDVMGRGKTQWFNTPSYCGPASFITTYTYDFAGNMTTFTDGVGETYTQTFSAANRVTQLSSSWVDFQHPAVMVSGILYNPAGAATKMTYGNGLTETAAYNNRLQPCRYNVNSSGSSLSLCTDSAPSGSVQDFTYMYNLGSSDNGNVASMAAAGAQAFNRNFTYDQLNRLSTMSSPSGPSGFVFCADEHEHCSFSGTFQVAYGANGTFVYQTLTNGTDCNNTIFGDPLVGTFKACYYSSAPSGCLGLSWTYDPWGNRTDQTVTAGTCNTFHAGVATNNRLISPYQYDAAGNMTYDGSHYYTYDAENRLTQVDGGSTATYVYDADGRRVQKSSGGAITNYIFDLNGQVISETSPSNWLNVYLRLNGKLFAQYTLGSPRTEFIHTDHLGSTRLVTSFVPGTPPTYSVYDNMDYLPFGEQMAGDTGTSHKFTGKERDAESGLDNFGARYMGSSLGRFMSPDPLGGHRIDPQTLNKYSYVRNNPLNLTDPTGLDFNLTCTQTRDNASTCQNGVQGRTTTDANGKSTFTATVISNDKNGNLVDQNGNQYNATISGAGVSFSQAGSNQPGSLGVFINGSNATTIQGTGGLSGFTFNFTYSNWYGNVTAGGTFSYKGTFQQAESALEKAGFHHYASDEYDIFHPSGLSGHAVDFRSAGDVGTGAGSGHFTVDEPWMFYPYNALRSPTNGDVHLGEHNNSTPGGFWPHTGEVIRTLLDKTGFYPPL